ncbi:Galanin receptor type 1 [Desmophyllum pertusum]|uniref:Galanin receptor type 1 n=1 Tax=Desmophyllum pertusum TaxID=174260 RepID=A0A9W9ZSA2_9CNID|nr:Galanin receptor type 1 [Desmophyllum pertusum]
MNNSTTQQLDINNHEPPCSQLVSTLFTVVLSIVSLAAFIGNILVIATFRKTPSLRTSTNYYLVNMAISDLLCGSFNWSLYATEGMLTRRVFITEPMASVVCRLGMYFRGISQVVSVLSLVLIAVDRYVAIVFPLKITVLRRKRVRLTLSLLTWIIPVASGLPYFLYTKIVKVNDQTFCRTMLSTSVNAIYNGVGFVLFYCTPLITMIILYSLSVKTLRKRSVTIGDRMQSQLNNKRQKQNQNIVKILISIVAGFFICWTPLCVYLALKMFHPALVARDNCMIFIGLFFYVFPSLSTAINPIILFLFSSNYRQALKSLSLHLCDIFKSRSFMHTSSNRIASSQNENFDTIELRYMSNRDTTCPRSTFDA